MKRVESIALGLLVLLSMPLAALAAGLFNAEDSVKVATEVAVLDEESRAGPLDFSPDLRFLAVDSADYGGTDIWDLDKQRIVKHLPESGASLWQRDLIRFSPNGKQLAICHDQDASGINIDIYDTSLWTKLHSIADVKPRKDGSGGCAGITFTPDGKELIRLAGENLTQPEDNIIFYDTLSWQVTRGIRTLPFANSALPWIDASKVSFLSTPTTLSPDPSNKTLFRAGTLSISKDGRYLALAGTSYRLFHEGPTQFLVVILDISNQTLSRVIPVVEFDKVMPTLGVESLDWNTDNIHIALGPIDENVAVKVYDSRSGDVVAADAVGPVHVLVRYTPDGKYFIEKVGNRVQIWDGQHQKLLQVIKAEPTYIAVSRDSHYFAMGGAKNSILDATPMLSLITHPNGPKGKILVYKLQ